MPGEKRCCGLSTSSGEKGNGEGREYLHKVPLFLEADQNATQQDQQFASSRQEIEEPTEDRFSETQGLLTVLMWSMILNPV